MSFLGLRWIRSYRRYYTLLFTIIRAMRFYDVVQVSGFRWEFRKLSTQISRKNKIVTCTS